MIYWFSGTGNSRFVAERLAELTGDTAQSIFLPPKETADVVGLVFPVYGWMPPAVVSQFIEKNLHSLVSAKYGFVVMTCGDDAGKALDLVRKQGFAPDSAFSVFMPNTYVSLPGFDVDSDKARKSKLGNCLARVAHIAKEVSQRRKTTDVHEGMLPRTKTYLLGRLSRKYLVDDRKFTANTSCNSCGGCQKTCPTGNITMHENRPSWNGNCTGCLACYHTCPKHAINFGSQTRKKGQYIFARHSGETNNL